jgi:hypothetical protein
MEKISTLCSLIDTELILTPSSSNDVLELEIDAGDTQYAAGPDSASRSAFQTLIDGDQWMIYRNVLTDVLHWDFVSAHSQILKHFLITLQTAYRVHFRALSRFLRLMLSMCFLNYNELKICNAWI